MYFIGILISCYQLASHWCIINVIFIRCYQLVGGVLMERTVGHVRPNLEGNASKISSLISTMEKTLDQKAKELLDFKEKHGIKVTVLKSLLSSFIILSYKMQHFVD